MGIIADLTAVVGLWSASPKTLVLLAAFLALVLGSYLIIHKWGERLGGTVLLALLSVVAGIVLIGVALWLPAAPEGIADGSGRTSPAAEPTTDTSTTGPPATTPTNTSTQINTPADAGGAVSEVRLERGTGVDLEAGETKGSRADGAVGKVDLYLTEFNLLYANGGGFYQDRGPENQAKARCTEAVTAQHDATPAILPASPGMQYCFATSGGRVTWLRVKHSTLSSFDSAVVVLAIRVWQS